MKNNSNEATTLRPEGDHLLNASLVELDLNKFIAKLKHETTGQTVTATRLLCLNHIICHSTHWSAC